MGHFLIILLMKKWSIGCPSASRDDILKIDDSEIEEMTEEEIQAYLENEAWEWAYNYIEVWFEKSVR